MINRRKVTQLVVCAGVAMWLAGCTPVSPVGAARGFMHALNNGRSDQAIDYICESMVFPAAPDHFLSRDHYKLLSREGNQAEVRITGQIKLDAFLGTIKQDLDFTVLLSKTSTGWCIQRDSLLGSFESFDDVIEWLE